MISFIIIAIVSNILRASSTVQMDTLGSMFIHRDKITLSGFSSGGTFAQQLQFSYSSLFSGIAVFSHTFYRCGPPNGSVSAYDRVCTKLANLTENELYDPLLVHNDIQDYHRRGLIEDPANLRNKRLYVYTGVRNLLFTPRQSLGILTVYERYIGSLQPIFTRVQDANLVMPTDNRIYGRACTELSENTFFIGQCGFSGVMEAVNFLLFNNLNTSSAAFNRYNTPRGTVSMFDQTEFTQGLQNHQMDSIGYYYTPQRCRRGRYTERRCYLHFYFHGCLSGREFANTSHVENTGLLELADRLGLIVIFPQAMSTLPENEIGCWDTFGISGRYYATQIGPQVRVLKRMLDKIMGKSGLPSSSSTTSQSASSIKWPNHHRHNPSYYNRRNGYQLSKNRNNGNHKSRYNGRY